MKFPNKKTQINKIHVKTEPSAAVYKNRTSVPKIDITSYKWRNIFYANGLKKQAGIAILISNKIDFKFKQKRWGRTLHIH